MADLEPFQFAGEREQLWLCRLDQEWLPSQKNVISGLIALLGRRVFRVLLMPGEETTNELHGLEGELPGSAPWRRVDRRQDIAVVMDLSLTPETS